MTRLGDDASGGVTEQALEVFRAVVVEVDLEPAHVGNVPFLAPAGVFPDGVDAEIDVVALRRSGGAARPGFFPAATSRRRESAAATSVESPLCARDGQNGHTVGAGQTCC